MKWESVGAQQLIVKQVNRAMPTVLQLKLAWFQFGSCLPARPLPATCCNTWRPKGLHVWTPGWWINPNDWWSMSQSCTMTCHYSLIRESERWVLMTLHMCPQALLHILCNYICIILNSQVIMQFLLLIISHCSAGSTVNSQFVAIVILNNISTDSAFAVF